MCVVPLGQFLGFQYTISIRVRPVETSYFGKISLTWLKQNLHRKGKTYACQDCQHPEVILTEQACSIKGQSGRSRASMIGPSCTRTGSQSEHRIRFTTLTICDVLPTYHATLLIRENLFKCNYNISNYKFGQNSWRTNFERYLLFPFTLTKKNYY